MKFACGGSRAIFTIDVEKLRHARRVATSDWHTHASQPVGQGIPDSRKSLGAEPCDGRKATVMSCRLKVGERLESQLLVEPIRKDSAHTGHGGKQPNGISFPAQAIQHRQSAVRQKLANRAGDGFADVRYLLQPVEAAFPKDFVQRLLHSPDARSRAEVRSDSESVGTLVLQQPGCLLKTSGHVLIDAVHHRSPLNRSSKHRSAWTQKVKLSAASGHS